MVLFINLSGKELTKEINGDGGSIWRAPVHDYSSKFTPARPFLCKPFIIYMNFHRKITQFWVLWNWTLGREFKKLQRQLQGKCHIKIELCVKLSLLRSFHVDHIVQNRRSALSLAWNEWFSCKGKESKIYYCELPLSSQLKYENFTTSFGRLRQNIAPKSVPHVQHDYFSSLNQSNHWFVYVEHSCKEHHSAGLQ